MRLAHAELGLLHIRNDVGHGAVIANRAGEHEVHVVLDALVHDALFEDTGFDGLAQRSGGADGVDGGHVIAVSAGDGLAVVQGDAERGSEQDAFDIVGADGVAAEQDLDVAVANELGQQRTGAAVHDGRAGDDEDLAAAGADVAHLAGDLLDDEALGMLGADVAAHEAEDFALARALGRQDADAFVADDDELSLADRGGGDHARLGSGGVDDDDQIHLGVLHLDPAAVEADLGGQVGGGVEIGRQDAVGGRGLVGYVVARGQDGAEGLQGEEDGLPARRSVLA